MLVYKYFPVPKYGSISLKLVVVGQIPLSPA